MVSIFRAMYHHQLPRFHRLVLSPFAAAGRYVECSRNAPRQSLEMKGRYGSGSMAVPFSWAPYSKMATTDLPAMIGTREIGRARPAATASPSHSTLSISVILPRSPARRLRRSGRSHRSRCGRRARPIRARARERPFQFLERVYGRAGTDGMSEFHSRSRRERYAGIGWNRAVKCRNGGDCHTIFMPPICSREA